MKPRASSNLPVTIAVLGNGGWGTALALHLRHLGHRVRLWSAFAPEIHEIKRLGENRKYLPGVRLPKDILLTADIEEAVNAARLTILAIPSQYLRKTVRLLAP